VTDGAFVNLDRFPNLTHLNIGSDAQSDAALVEVAKLKHLKDLRLAHNPKITDAGMVHIEKLSTLAHLDISGCSVTDEGLKALRGLRELNKLTLTETKITDAGFDAVDLPKLRQVDLTETAITDAGVAKLSKFPALEVLVLNGCRVGDGCLPSLKECPKIHLVQAFRTKVTKAGAAEFKKQMPEGFGVATD
jgi:hypothetical protein